VCRRCPRKQTPAAQRSLLPSEASEALGTPNCHLLPSEADSALNEGERAYVEHAFAGMGALAEKGRCRRMRCAAHRRMHEYTLPIRSSIRKRWERERQHERIDSAQAGAKDSDRGPDSARSAASTQSLLPPARPSGDKKTRSVMTAW
jgi:hypothetical protein